MAAVTLLGTFAIERAAVRSEMAQLDERSGAIASALERKANTNASYLRASAVLFAIRSGTPETQFRHFVGQLWLGSDYRGARSIGWAPRIERNQVDAFNRAMALQYGKGVRLRPPLDPGQPYAMPVAYMVNVTGGGPTTLGFDMYSEPVRRAAMLEAERSGRPTASGKLVLLKDRQTDSPGFIIYMPVFADAAGMPAAAPSQRLRGFVYGSFNAHDFLATVLQQEGIRDLAVRLYDGTREPAHLLASIGSVGASGASVKSPLTIANHRWTVVVTARDRLPLTPLAIATLAFGLAGATLLMLLARIISQQALEDSARLTWFEQQISIRDSLSRELNHRVKNTLANVLSIVALTKRRSQTLDDFTERLEGRIRALSATHDLLTNSQWGSTPIRAVIEAELTPYSRDMGQMIEITGPAVELAPNDALSLGLAIHELATNAAKYGALSRPGGRLWIDWVRLGENLARISWREEGGPPVPEQRKRGFGMELIERIVANELQNPVEMHFDPDGVRCTLTVPVRKPNPFAIREVASDRRYATGLREPKNSA
ncbi:MAG TPA: CHASE domain-containing protein [Sphingomonadaceae bacterium]